MRLTQSQFQAKQQLFFTLKINNKREVWFKAPTGAGKTFITAHLIKDLFEFHKNDNTKAAVIFLTLSKGNLPYQLLRKFNEYALFSSYLIEAPSNKKDKTKSDNPYLIKSLTKNQEVFILGQQTLTNKSILMDNHEFKKFIIDLESKNYQLYLFWDEAHIGTGKASKRYCQGIINEIFGNKNYQTLKLTATPKNKPLDVPLIQLTKKQAEYDCLIKSQREFILNNYVDYTFDKLLNTAINKYQILKSNYKQFNINPAMLIQIEPKNSADKLADKERETLDKITALLEKNHLNWFIWLSDIKKSNLRNYDLNEITNNNSDINVIIFKQAISEGWDIPRACMLIRLREIVSSAFAEQVVGRILRNPLNPLQLINHEANAIFKKYYILSNKDEKGVAEPINLKIKSKYKNENFYSINVNWAQKERGGAQQVKQYLDKNKSTLIKNICAYYHKKEYIERILPQISLYTIDFVKKITFKTDPITNLLKIYQLWYSAFSNDSLRTVIDKWINENSNFKLSNDDDSCIKNWEWYIYFLDLENQIEFKMIKQQYEKRFLSKYQQNKLPLEHSQHPLSSDVELTKDTETITLTQKQLLFFPYEWQETKSDLVGKIYLDSAAEATFISKMLNFLEDQTTFNNIKLATKNFTPSKITYEIISSDFPSTNTMPDVLVRLDYKNVQYTFVIEIKSGNDDYDKVKSEQILIQYQNFARELKTKNYIFCLAYQSNDNAKLKYICFYKDKLVETRRVSDIFNIIVKNTIIK